MNTRRALGMLMAAGSIGLATTALQVGPASAAPATPVFGIAHSLGPAGGEPSIQDDGHGRIYVTTPLGTGSMGNGVRLSRSFNDGISWLKVSDNEYVDVGATIGGGDSDVLTDPSGDHLWIADLAAADSGVLMSPDHGNTFPQQATTAFEDDREWISYVGGDLTIAYHDFVQNIPLIYGSTDNGATWAPRGFAGTGQIIGPADTGFTDAKCNTLVAKPVVDEKNTMYVLTNTSTLAEDIAVGVCLNPQANVPMDRFYLSVSSDKGHSFTTHLVNDISAATTGNTKSGTWGRVFNQLAIDAGGNLYIAASGTLDGSPLLQTYLLVSKDHGATFSKPIHIHADPNAQLFPAIAVGQAGQVAVGYYQGTKPDNQATGSNFQFVIDETLNALDAAPTFTHTVLPPIKGTTPHPDGICTAGTFCILPTAGGNRNLADFESMTVDPSGHLEVIIPADCDACNSKTENWFYKQTGGPLLVPGKTNYNGTGGQTYVSGTVAPSPSSAPSPSPTPLPNTAAGVHGSPIRAGLGALGLVLAAWTLGLWRRRPRTA